MSSRSFLPKPSGPPAAERARRALLGAIALVALGAAAQAGASSAPAWMHDLVAVPLPAHDDKTSAVLLYSETVFTVRGNGKMRRLERRAYKILRPEGAGRGTVRVDFDEQSRITDLHAWCIPADGKDFQVKEKDAVETALGNVENGELMGDERSKLLRIPAAIAGSIVGYEFEQEQRPYLLDDQWDVQDTVPVRETRYTLQLPPGWGYKATWINHAEVAPAAGAAGEWRWTLGDVAPVHLEEQMPPWRGIAARMVIALIPPGGQAPGWATWREVGNWYLNLVRGRTEASPEIRQKAAALTASETTTLGKIGALARFVQTDIRYVAIELGIGGHQPHPAAEVFAHRYGDCKDKATLLATMLHEIGVDSYYTIINTVRGTVAADTPANLSFNHAILAIRLPAGVEDARLLATVVHPSLGRILYFDPTDSMTPLGGLSGPLQANYGLLVTPDGGELVALPQLPASTAGILRKATLALDANGALRGDVVEVRVGDPAADERRSLHAAALDVDRIKPVEARVASSLSTFKIVKAQIANLEEPGLPFEWHYSFEAPSYAKTSGDLLLVRPRVLGSKSSALLETKEPRHNPVEFLGPQRDSDTFEIALPPGYEVDELPAPVAVDYGFAAYHSKTELVGRVLRYTRTMEIKELAVPVARTEDLRAFYRIIATDERRAAVLKATGH
jgi:Domain of Unknown Function with PDB structure (DUF3857)/Transglutaminase-like superfamily